MSDYSTDNSGAGVEGVGPATEEAPLDPWSESFPLQFAEHLDRAVAERVGQVLEPVTAVAVEHDQAAWDAEGAVEIAKMADEWGIALAKDDAPLVLDTARLLFAEVAPVLGISEELAQQMVRAAAERVADHRHVEKPHKRMREGKATFNDVLDAYLGPSGPPRSSRAGESYGDVLDRYLK